MLLLFNEERTGDGGRGFPLTRPPLGNTGINEEPMALETDAQSKHLHIVVPHHIAPLPPHPTRPGGLAY